MKLSIVIPARNEFPQICFTIYSIIQDLETFLQPGDWEIIIVNNCSNDEEFPRRALGGTTDYLMSRGMYWNGLLRVVYDPQAGNHSARNLGAKVAQGDYVFFSDGHMSYNVGFFKSMLKTCEESGGIAHATINWMGAYPPTHVGYQYTIKLGEEIKGCVDEKTEILTKNGWKKWNEVDYNTEFATVKMNGKESKTIEFQKPRDIVIKDYDGEMVKIIQENYDALLTPNHRCYSKLNRSRSDYEWRVKQAKDIKSDDVLPVATKGTIKTFGAYKDSLVELIGWIVAEGHYSSDGTIVIVQTNRKKHSNIISLIKNLGLSYCIKSKRGDIKIHQNDSKTIKDIIPNKELTFDFLNNCSRKQLDCLYESLIASDGHRSKSNDKFYQVNNTTSDSFQYLCILLGMQSKKYLRTKDDFGENHYGNKPINVISVKKRFSASGLNIVNEKYTGKVWCPDLKNGNVFIRRNGQTALTGNTWSNYAPSTDDWFYIPAQGHCSLMINRKQFLDFGGYPKYHRTYGGGEFYLNMKWWMFGSCVVCDPKAFGYHLACGRGYNYSHEREYIHNVLYIGKILGMDDWVERTYINYLRHHNKDTMNKLMEESEIEANRGERQFVSKKRKKTFNQLICERPWDKLNDQKFGRHNSGLVVYHDTIIPLFQETEASKQAWENAQYKDQLDKFINENLSEFVYRRKIVPTDSL